MCTRSALVEKLIRSLQQGLQREDTLIGWSECLSLVKIDWMNDWLMCGKATKRAVLLQKGTNCPLCKSYPTMSDTLNRELGKLANAKFDLFSLVGVSWLVHTRTWESSCIHQFSPPSYDDLFILLWKASGWPPTSSLPPPSSSSSDKASVWRILSKSQLLVLQSSHLLISFYVLSRGSTAVRDILDYHIITFSSSSSLLLG